MRFKDLTLPIYQRTCIMGILNVTPDSFSAGAVYKDPAGALKRADQMVSLGADIIDVGGESSRPGAVAVEEKEEIERVVPVIKAIKRSLKVPISIDTCKSEVAREALKAGADIINDITALRRDEKMARVAVEFKATVVLMHMKGTPRTMQKEPLYDDVVEEIYSYLSESASLAESAGVAPEKIIIDPGIGFGKTLEHNIRILKKLKKFRELKKPVLVGTSRKSFIGALTGRDVNERMFGDLAAFALAIQNGADILRVHDVGAACDVARVADSMVR
ncbi:MAG: dihydropteroate synthase [Candidatus Omnitrophica bacterium]|nr:dihydropteroate synthase [Candidatus Omnitrophota bacterium]